MDSKTLNILIVGGGIAGVVLALLCEEKNYNVTLIEQSKSWLPVGGGITITLNGVKLLEEIGLLPEIEPTANEIRNINIADQNGSILSSFALDEYATGYAKTLTILRHDLHTALVKRLTRTTIYLNTTFTSINNEGDGVQVELSNGMTERYHLVAGCDGIKSAVRNAVFGWVKNKYAGYSSWRFIATDVKGIDATTVTEMWGNGKRFGIVPLRNNKVHCFASVNTTQNHPANHNISLQAFKSLFAGFGGQVPAILDSLKQTSELMYNDLEDVRLQKCYKGRVVLLGDAAHGMTPNLTQGASMAIEDALVLANQLSEAAVVETDLEIFYLQRKKRVIAIQKKSNLLGKIGQIDAPVLCSLRNFCWKMIPDKWIQNDLKNLLTSQVGAVTQSL